MATDFAIVGATGNVGTEMLEILSESDIDVGQVYAVASRNSLGREVSFGDRTLKCQDIETFDFSKCDIALMSAGGSVSKEWSPRIAAKGAVVIDNSSAWRMDPDVPLVVPEVNADAVEEFGKKNIIANPNCSTIQMVVALKPLHDRATVKRVVVSTYQSVSGAGKKAMDELWLQTKGIYSNEDLPAINFPKQIAFNVIPQIDVFMEDGYTKEEWKMKVETKKILGSDVRVAATCVRVPTFVGHAEAINVELAEELSADDARALLRESPGLMVIDQPDGEDANYITPIECVGEFATFVSRIREDSTQDNTLDLWVVSDNLRKGAALNAVQIAELLVHRGLLNRA
ncbi:aspartate-semialdehyde dehydrogenase [uncultured Algimonas sp.]|uniref:aspartate-semialdehyde dehydrogenase n=1 Tax=uncultured Algimonas sp. TaxID=1547920 RepID=UPI0026357253|nr:aspartate-semialdehyde dehydrogenase [uncultured Algimonas sp.]